ncbi:hypothetical protein [Natrarchaeobius chitinivorans]|uniref:Uncharacterized protein n=1 Tax=Natrarchaeobius chitinivorans TaxID=1679083 RepID=A0A3N6M5H5_NATCH|nr:hypothetical protein [Natrarchaeobius chitinivorans]RQG97317.1 hypothetical protein EA473_04445 [Natrarchaeobius chitinivorans]
MLVLVVGFVLVGLGLAGIRYAPAIVDAQHRQGMTPYTDGPIEKSDRVVATKGVGVVFAVVGVVLVGYGAGFV